MRIINVVEIISNTLDNIQSFPILEEQLSKEVIENAENLFKIFIKENSNLNLTEKDLQNYVDDGYFDDKNGYIVYLTWSNINL